MNEYPGSNYLDLNRRNWDERAPVHAASPSYQVDRLVADPQHLSEVVSFDLPLLGRLDGLDVVHLQCHIGTDTVSLARLGARSITGLDLSPASLAEARSLAAACALDVDFVESEVYRAVDVLGECRFDLVYTGVGALNWLPSIERWAGVVAALLRPGGRLFIRDGHPMMYTLPIRDHYDDLRIELPYFETDEPIVTESDTTYVVTDARLENTRIVEWNHGLGEMVTALIDHGMDITALTEHRSVPWEAIPGLMEQIGGDEYALREGRDRLPLSFTLQARKR